MVNGYIYKGATTISYITFNTNCVGRCKYIFQRHSEPRFVKQAALN